MGLDVAAERERIADERTKAANKEAMNDKVKQAARNAAAKATDATANALIGKFICKDCGYHGRRKALTKGSFIVEVVLWIIALGIAVITLGVGLIGLLIPLIYSLWRVFSKYKGCPKCEGHMIKTDSPMGKKLVKELSQ